MEFEHAFRDCGAHVGPVAVKWPFEIIRLLHVFGDSQELSMARGQVSPGIYTVEGFFTSLFRHDAGLRHPNALAGGFNVPFHPATCDKTGISAFFCWLLPSAPYEFGPSIFCCDV